MTAPVFDRRAIVVLTALLAVLVLQRLHTYDEPLERDLTTYAVIGHEALAGRWLYSDLWDNKSPLVFATYAAGELVAGYGPRAIFALGVLAATITLVGVYAAATTLSGSAAAGLWAAAAWTLVCADQALEANQPNIEVFLNACLVWLLVLFAAARVRPVAIGIVAAVASLYKLVVMPTLVLWHLAHVLRSPRRRAALSEATIAIGLVVLVWAAVAAYFAVTGRGEVFREALFAYNESYAGDLVGNLAVGLAPGQLLPRALWCALPLVVLAPFGVLGLVRAGRVHAAMLWIAYAVGTATSVALPGKFWPHYYQLWLPVLAICGGIGIEAVGRLFRPVARPRRRGAPEPTPVLPRVVGAAALLVIAGWELPYFGQSAESWSRAKYGDIFVETKRAAAVIDSLLAPGETFVEWGDETGLYYSTRRHPPSGIFYVAPVIVRTRQRVALAQRMVRDLERTRPELLVTNVRYLYPGLKDHPVVGWFGTHYYRWETGPDRGPFDLFVRVGGALEERLRRSGKL
jgi:hypothetical protein